MRCFCAQAQKQVDKCIITCIINDHSTKFPKCKKNEHFFATDAVNPADPSTPSTKAKTNLALMITWYQLGGYPRIPIGQLSHETNWAVTI